MLATGILVFALGAILATYISCSVLVSTCKNVNIATNGAAALMEEIRTGAFSSISDDYHGVNFTVNDISSSRGVVYVNDSNSELLKVTISVCWPQGARVIGEDKNLNGILDSGEDANSNGILDSPVQLVTQIANR